MKNYGMPFKNAAIDKLGSKFGDPDKPKVEGPVNLMGVQNALNKGVAFVKEGARETKMAAQTLANTKINNPVKVKKTSETSTDWDSPVFRKETTSSRKGLIGDRTITKKSVKDYGTGDTTYSRSTTNFQGGRKFESSKRVSSDGDMNKSRTLYDQRGNVMTSKSSSKTGKFLK
jgi:hypothetical protein